MEEVKDSDGNIIAKVASPAEALWTRVRDECISIIKSHEDSLVIQRAFLTMCEQKIAEVSQ